MRTALERINANDGVGVEPVRLDREFIERLQDALGQVRHRRLFLADLGNQFCRLAMGNLGGPVTMGPRKRFQRGAIGLSGRWLDFPEGARGVEFRDQQAEASADLCRRGRLVAEQRLVGSHEFR
jgi:hypothetical protein